MSSYESLLTRVRQVRRRWRSQVIVRGVSLFLASTIALLVLGVWGADLFGFKPAAVWSMRILAAGTVLFVAWYFLYVRLRTRVSDVQIAQLIEERYPQIEDRLVAAIEFGSAKTEPFGMIDLLISDALEKTSRVDFSIFLNWKRLALFGTIGIGAFLALFALLTWGPRFFPYGFTHLYIPWTEASDSSLMSIRLMPGDIEIAKGADQLIQAQLVGFDSPDVKLFQKPEGSNQWSALAMELDPRSSGFRYLLLDIRASMDYYVESKGVRSSAYSLKVVDLARVDKIGLTYHFPAYTGMKPQTIENEGDISALKGTKIDIKIHTNGPAQSANLLFDDHSTLNLTRTTAQDFSGSFPLQRSGSYVVQIAEALGKTHPGSSEYEMEALDDAAPKVTVAKPMKDVRATSVEEVFSEIKAEDDIGIGKVELHYSVNGGQEKTVNLYNGKPPEQSVTAAHTFFLEDFGLQPGDMVAYYGKAWDNNNVTGPRASSSNIYFIEIRPFEKKYVQNQQGQAPTSGGQQGQGGQEGQEGENQQGLSKQQKEIISATFNLQREKDQMPSKDYLDGLKTLALVQSKLKDQAQKLVDRLQRRGAEQVDEDFGKLAEYLKNAIGSMGKAAANLGEQKPDTAMPQEQKSLQQLLRAESLYKEIQVSFQEQNAQNGNSRSQTNAEDLADLFELEMNKLKNQYETVQRGEQQARDQKVDEALQRLKELAQRQQQVNERNRMMAQQGRMSSSSSGGSQNQSQQQLMEQAEQLQRQLQRLLRERSSQQLNEASNQLQKAIDEMKKSLQAQNRSGAEASAQGLRAQQQLDDAARRLAREQDAGLSQGVNRAVDESRKLVEEQKKIQETLGQLAKEGSQGAISDEAKRRGDDLVSRKSTLADRLRNLGNQAQDLARQARKTQKETSNRLADAAGAIQDNRLPERIKSGNALIQNGYYEDQKPREDIIRRGMEEANRQLEAARNSIGQTREGKIEEAANRARQLAEGLESMQQRMRGMQSGQSQSDRSGRGQTQQGQQAQGRGQQQQGQGQQAQGQGQSQQGQGQQDQGQQGQQGQGRGQSPQGQGQQGQGQQAQGRGQQQQGQGQQGQGRGQSPQGQGQQMQGQGQQAQGRGQQPQGQGQQGQGRGQSPQGQGQQAQGQGQQQGQMPGQIPDQNAQNAQGARGQIPQNMQNMQAGRPDSESSVLGPSRNSSGPPTGIGSPRNEAERQLSREFEQRLADAQDLRRLLDRNSTPIENLDKAIESLRRADRDDVSPEQIARLKAAIDSMRKVELDLARDLEKLSQKDKYFFAEDNEAPGAYRKLVDEYYKSIAKTK